MPNTMSLALLRQNLGLSRQGFVSSFVATKLEFVVTKFCFELCRGIVFAQQLVFLLQLVGATIASF